ncbi:MAG: MAPEG family protein [Oceanospirillaceae bacterium]|nr:MAPEG family protein [Oceanospirillaceae bacterium]MCP5351045.1 MAPEG family protein [Oceanospirillaceae bacterium]
MTALILLGLCAWSLFLLLLLITWRSLRVLGGKQAINTFSTDGHEVSAANQRLVRALANSLENLPLSATIFLLAIASGHGELLTPLAPLFLMARICQSLIHMLSISPVAVALRFSAYTLQLGLLVYWITLLAPHFL